MKHAYKGQYRQVRVGVMALMYMSAIISDRSGAQMLHLGWLLGLDHCKQLPGRAYHQKAGASNIKDRGERKVDGEGH